jgi:hypothetical protein
VRIGEAAKAVGIALAILVLNLVATTLAVFAYAQWIAPGLPADAYDAAALDIAAWTAPVGGALLFLALGLWFGRLARGRPMAFIFRVWVAYVILDLVSGAALAGVASLLSLVLLGSLAAALLGGVAGVLAANRWTPSGEQTA